ncbi:long-chain fatty acid-CoA ligase [Rhizophlyctis rosea]|nr:long-chain fatty acid-CoA ligase [Rhizophlyctis rosea]
MSIDTLVERPRLRGRDGTDMSSDDRPNTLFELMKWCGETWGNADCMGWRDVLETDEVDPESDHSKKESKQPDASATPNEKDVSRESWKQDEKENDGKKGDEKDQKPKKKKWTRYRLSDYEWTSYKDVAETSRFAGAGLVEIGCKADDKILVFAKTCREWLPFVHGAFSQTIIIATVYDALGVDGVRQAAEQCNSTIIFASEDLLPIVSEAIPKAQTVIYVGKQGTEEDIKKKYKLEKVGKIISFDDLVKLGRESGREPRPPGEGDLACIMYTSGSTGTPKGVELTHKNVMASIAGIERIIGDFVTHEDSYIGYLPLAHVLELVLEHYVLLRGVRIGYANPRTLTDGPALHPSTKSDFRALQPTLAAGVPAIWERVRKGILSQLTKLPQWQQWVVQGAAYIKWLGWKVMPEAVSGVVEKGVEAAVLGKVKEAFGGRLRLMASGGAAMQGETQRFLAGMMCPVLQGYGLTETAGIVSFMLPSIITAQNTVGAIAPNSEVKLVAMEENEKYKVENGEGEIWVRGPSVMRGYYQAKDKTEEAMTEDGWFRTGDIGRWNTDGTLSIIDRAKNLVKQPSGEYVAVEKLESEYNATPHVKSVCIIADGDHDTVIAVVVASDKNASEDSVLQSLQSQAKQRRLRTSETVSAVILDKEEWTPENGMVTPAGKVQRKKIQEKFEEEIKGAWKK